MDVYRSLTTRRERLYHRQAAEAIEAGSAVFRRDFQQRGEDASIAPMRDGGGFEGFLEVGAVGLGKLRILEVHSGQGQLRRVALGGLENAELCGEVHVMYPDRKSVV